MKVSKTWQPCALYLANLLVAPLLAYLVLVLLFWRSDEEEKLKRFHTKASFWLATLSGVILLGVPVSILLLGGFSDLAWMFALTFLVTTHGAFVILGVYILAKAMNEQTYWFPFLNDLR